MWSLTLNSMDALAAALMLSPFHGVVGTSGVMEIRWRPPTKAEVREIVRRYHDVPNEATLAPFDVIEFEKQLHAGASDDYTNRNDDDGAAAARPAAAA